MATATAPRPQQMQIGVHQGSTLLKLAGEYPDLLATIEEAVQNSLDKNATDIRVTLNQRTRRVAIRDNGDGVSMHDFSVAINQVGRSVKGKGKLGQFGIGFVSPLNKSEKFTFTSCAAPQRFGYLEWTLAAADIKDQHHSVSIPMRERHDLYYQGTDRKPQDGKANVWWRSEVDIYNFQDGVISQVDIEELKGNILAKYSHTMLRLKTRITLAFTDALGNDLPLCKFNGEAFIGTPLPEVVMNRPDCGKVIIRMFLTSKRQREKRTNINLQFGVIGNDYRVIYANFAKSITHTKDISAETMEALKSGHFEGEILGEKLNLSTERAYFVRDDASLDFHICIDEWFKTHGKQHYLKASKDNRHARYQQCGLHALDSLERLLKANSALLDTARGIAKFGTIGAGHSNPDYKVKGTQSSPSLTPRGGAGKPRQSSSQNSGTHKSTNNGQRGEQPDHLSLSVQGTHGTNRKIVRGRDTGIAFAHDPMTHSRRLWILERDEGVIVLNTTHPDWTACEDNDAMLSNLHEIVAMAVLTIEMSEEPSQLVERYADQLVSYQLQLANNKRSAKAKKAFGRGKKQAG
jgi:hypothetical protein